MKCCRSLAWPRWQGAPLLPVHWYGKEAQHRQRGHARLLAMLIQALMCSSAVSVVKRLRVKLSTRVWGSSAAWMATIEVYIRVALSDRAPAIALMPGKIGREYERSVLGLPDARSVQIANFVGPSLEFVQRTLVEAGRHLETLWLLSHPGKLVKVLNGYWDTHSSKSVMAMSAVARVAVECGISRARVRHIEQANTMEEVVTILSDDQLPARQLWCEVERRIAAL